MTSKPEQSKPSLIEFFQSIHLYSRWELSKRMGSKYSYGDGEFGDATILAKAKKEFFEMQEKYGEYLKDVEDGAVEKEPPTTSEDIRDDKGEYGNLYMFHQDTEHGETDEPERPVTKGNMGMQASNRTLSDFLGKEYLVDISPEFVYVIFPDMTIHFTIDTVMDAPWEQVRSYLQEQKLVDFDVAGASGEALSLDKIRRKLGAKGKTMTDDQIADFRRRTYGFAEVILQTTNENIQRYE